MTDNPTRPDDERQPAEGQKIWIRQLDDGSHQWQPREGYGNPSEDGWITP